MIQLSANELGVFKACIEGPTKQYQIAESVAISAAAVSQIAGRLIGMGLCCRREEGLSSSDAEHAIALRSALHDSIVPEWTLVGGHLPIVLSLLRAPKPMERVAMETRLALSTVKVYEKRLREHALTVSGRNMELAPKNTALVDFLEKYAHGNAVHLASISDSSARVAWNDGLQSIIRTDRNNIDRSLRITGLNYLTGLGLRIGSWYTTYRWSFWNGEIGIEQACIHAHLNERDSSTAISYCILAIMDTPYDKKKLLEEAGYVGVERLMRKVVQASQGEAVEDPLIIPRSELDEMRSTIR